MSRRAFTDIGLDEVIGDPPSPVLGVTRPVKVPNIAGGAGTLNSPGSTPRAAWTSLVGRGVTRGDRSIALGLGARGLLTALSLVYAIVCTTVVGVLDCRAPGALARLAGSDGLASVDLPDAALVAPGESEAAANVFATNSSLAGNQSLQINRIP